VAIKLCCYLVRETFESKVLVSHLLTMSLIGLKQTFVPHHCHCVSKNSQLFPSS